MRLKPDNPLLLFDLAQDIGEQHDVAAQNPEVAAKFETYLSFARTESKAWPLSTK